MNSIYRVHWAMFADSRLKILFLETVAELRFSTIITNEVLLQVCFWIYVKW